MRCGEIGGRSGGVDCDLELSVRCSSLRSGGDEVGATAESDGYSYGYGCGWLWRVGIV